MQREANRGAAMDVGGWLRGFGFEQYEAAFPEKEIDDTVLPRLTAEDLRELGVASVGHRRRLLDAIAALPTEAGSASDLGRGAQPKLGDTPIDNGGLAPMGGGRAITVVCCD